MTRPLQLAEEVLREPRSLSPDPRLHILAQRVIELEKAVREWADTYGALQVGIKMDAPETEWRQLNSTFYAAEAALRSLLADAGPQDPSR